MSHVTGGGFANNLARVVRDGLKVSIDRATWTPAPIFQMVQRIGNVSQADIEATLNMGVGMAAVLPESEVDAARSVLTEAGIDSWVCGRVEEAAGEVASVTLVGAHPAE